jgi:small subunit ribosomal protein S2
MVESTGGPSPETVPTPAVPVGETELAAEVLAPPREISVRAFMESGAHFGHQTRRWDPRMAAFIFGESHGVHIIDLDQSVARMRRALGFLRDTVAGGGKVLFVGTKRQAQAPVRLEAERCEQFYVNNRWLGGMLTNFRTVKKSIERFKEHLELLDDPEKVAALSKKELARIHRSVAKYRKSLEGIANMTRLPDALFVIDVGKEHIALSEARRLGIPVVAVVDTNCSPEGIDFVVPGNDDAIRAISLYCGLVANACAEGEALHAARVQAEVSEQETGRRPEMPGTGRRVVEIKQPPRRGRGAASMGRRPRRAGEGEEAAEPVEAAAPAAPAEEPPRPAASPGLEEDARSGEA